VQAFDLAVQVVQITVVDHNVIGDIKALFAAGLGRQDGVYVGAGDGVSGGNPLVLQLRRRVNDQDSIQRVVSGGFQE
jgi:hypothetical protein